MEYYIVEISASCAGTDPVDANGNFVDMAGTPKPWEVDQAFITVPYTDDEADTEFEDSLLDTINVGLDWLISQRMYSAFKDADIGPEVGFLPAIVRNRRGHELATYYLVYSRESYSVLDVKLSGAKLFEGGAIDEVDKWVLDLSVTPARDLFYAHHDEWVASERLRALVRHNELRGMSFRKIGAAARR